MTPTVLMDCDSRAIDPGLAAGLTAGLAITTVLDGGDPLRPARRACDHHYSGRRE